MTIGKPIPPVGKPIPPARSDHSESPEHPKSVEDSVPTNIIPDLELVGKLKTLGIDILKILGDHLLAIGITQKHIDVLAEEAIKLHLQNREPYITDILRTEIRRAVESAIRANLLAGNNNKGVIELIKDEIYHQISQKIQIDFKLTLVEPPDNTFRQIIGPTGSPVVGADSEIREEREA